MSPSTADLIMPMENSPETYWHVYTLADAYKERDPIKYVAGNLFSASSVNVVYGAPGSMKSFVLADLMIHVVTGIPWLQPLPGKGGQSIPVTKGNCIWVDFDNGVRQTHDRFKALGQALEVPMNAPLYYFSMPEPRLDAGDKTQIEKLAENIKERNVILVVIDNLGTICGKADENSAEMVTIFANLRGLAEETGAAIIIIHHRRKSSGGREGDALRGHSSIEASLDLALLVEREGNSKTINIRPTKVRGSDVAPFSAIFTFQHDDLGQLQKAQFISGPPQELVTMNVIEKAIYECANDNPTKKGTLQELAYEKLAMKVGKNCIRDAIDKMIVGGNLYKTLGKNNSQLITRSNDKPV